MLSALFFFPRGGSAQVARALAGALPERGWRMTLASGSLGGPGASTHAASFYSGMDISAVEYSPALEFSDPLAAAVPFQPSYEDRPAGPDRVFATVDDAAYERLVSAWAEALARAGAAEADLLHLHHLTPVHEAALRAFPSLPIVGQLHGTELAFLRALAAGPPQGWRHAHAWEERLRRWARACERLLDRLVAGQAARRLLGTVALGRARGRRPVRHTLAVRGFVGRRAGPFGRVILTFGLPANDGSPVASTKGRACHLPNSCGACPCLLRRPQTKRAQKHRPLAQGRSRLWSRQAEAGRKRLPVGNARRRCGRSHAVACSRRSSSFRAGGRHRSPARSPGRCPRGAGG